MPARMDNPATLLPDSVQAVNILYQRELAALVLWIATTNFFNRINVTTAQQAPQNWG